METVMNYILQQVAEKKMSNKEAKIMLSELQEAKKSPRENIAIIGMACRFPDADNKEEYWDNLINGVNSIRNFPESRKVMPKELNLDRLYQPGGYLDDIDKFDAAFFRISPKEAEWMSPGHRIMLETAYAAVEDSGYGPDKLYGTNTGVYIGHDHSVGKDYQMFCIGMETSDPMVTTGSFPSLLSRRISYHMNLKGPSIVIDTACSSGLVAVHYACEALKKKECETAVAGSLFLRATGIGDGGLSVVEGSDGLQRTFDERSEGTTWGEGVAAVILKPLNKAIADGDNIYAVIRGSSVNNDATSSGITAPNAESQEELLARVWSDLKINVENISYIEAHGTGTKIGDPIEIMSLTNAFRRFTRKKQFCGIGTVKTNIGHLVSSSGLASLIKVALCLKNSKIPPTINFEIPNRYIDFHHSPIYINDSLNSWEKGETPRLAAINCFGFSGTNCHMILEEAPQEEAMVRTDINKENKAAILALSAKDKEVLKDLVKSYIAYLDGKPEAELEEICNTANTGRSHYEYRIAIICTSKEDLKEKLISAYNMDLQPDKAEDIYYGFHRIVSQAKGKQEEGMLTEGERQKLNKLAYAESQKLPEQKEEYGNVLKKIAEYYVAGASIKWEELTAREPKWKKTSLPTYPFKKIRYWAETNNFRLVSGGMDKASGAETITEVKLSGKNDNEYTEMERTLGQIWSEVMGYAQINIYDNFYELGGNSIALIRLTAKIKEVLGVDIGPGSFMEGGSVSRIAEMISSGELKENNSGYIQWEADPANMYEPFPLTEVQMAYLMGRDSSFELGGVVTHVYTEYRTGLDMERLSRSLQKVIERHPMLRAVFTTDGRQRILEEVPPYKVKVRDISFLNEEEQHKCIMEEREKSSHKVFDPQQWPLFEFKAFKLSEGTHYLFIGFDMLIADGASLQIIGQEGMHYYDNPDIELPKLDFTFRDYILAYKEFKKSEIYLRDKEYWLKKLENFPSTPALPLMRNPGDIGKPHFNRYQKIFDKDSFEMFKKAARSHNISVSTLLCTAYAEILAYWSNQYRMGLSLTVFSRYPFNKSVNEIIGDFTAVLLLSIDLEPDTAFWERTAKVQKVMMEALEHRHYDGVEFIREISKFNSLGNKAAMPVVFNSMLGNMTNQPSGSYGLGETEISLHQTPQVYLENQATERDDCLSITWDYVEQLFDEEMISAMFNQYIELLYSLTEDGSGYKMQPPLKDRLIIEQYNASEEAIPVTTIHQLFVNQVKATPHNYAIEYGDTILTYEELHRKSNQVAHYLIKNGIGRHDMVAVLAHRCEETIINMLGILKAGGAYVPIEPEYPAERKDYMIENSKCKLVIGPGLYVGENLSEYPTDDICCNNPDDIAYVIYTSGSTGRPKGVVITHVAAVNTIIDINNKFNVNETDRILGISSMCFDLSVYDIFGALSTGATLVMIPDQRDVRILLEAVENRKITVWNSVPAVMGMLLDNVEANNDCMGGFSSGIKQA